MYTTTPLANDYQPNTSELIHAHRVAVQAVGIARNVRDIDAEQLVDGTRINVGRLAVAVQPTLGGLRVRVVSATEVCETALLTYCPDNVVAALIAAMVQHCNNVRHGL